jgi:hypothetical protein
MSKAVTWAGWSTDAIYKPDGSSQISYHFHSTNNKKNCIWINMPESNEAHVKTYTFYKMPPNTDRASAKNWLTQLATDQACKVMLMTKEVRVKRGPRKSKAKEANEKIKSALE